MSKSEKPSNQAEELKKQIEALRNNVQPVMDFIGQSLSVPMMGLIADEMGLTKEGDKPWDLSSFAKSMDDYDRRNAHERARLVNSVFGDIFETLSELSAEQLVENSQVIDLLRAAYDDVMIPLQQAGAYAIEELFCESHPFFDGNIPRWRKAAFLSHVAYVYQRTLEAKKDLIGWLKKASEPNDDLAIEEGLHKTYQAFVRGDYDF